MGDLRRYAAVNAGARSLLPGLLGASQLQALCGYPTADAVREALLRTAYGPGLAREGAAEAGVALRLAEVGAALLRLLDGREREFLHACLLLHEVENLKLVIRAVHRRRGWAAIAALVVDLPGIATLDCRSLVHEPDLGRLAERLRATPYGPACRHALHAVERAGAFAVEVGVEIDFYERLWARAGTLRRPDAARARRLLGILFDVINLGWIARYRDALALSSEEILSYTLRPGRWVTLEVRRRLARERPGTWVAPLAGTPYAPWMHEAESGGFDAAAPALWALLLGEVRRGLHGDPFHIGVPLGLLLAQAIEVRDLRTLLAAKRLGLPAEEVHRALATAHRGARPC